MIKNIRLLGRISFNIAWAGVIILLPVTSFPLLSRLAGDSMVAPASFIPVCWLALFWFIPYAIKKNTLPRETIPFLLFVSIALVASACAFFYQIPSYKGGGIPKEEAKAILTLLIGAIFYLVTSGWLLKSTERIALTLKMIDIGGSIMLLWALCQGIFIFFFHGKYPDVLYQFQAFFSIRGLFPNRMTSFAFEPSWLAQQLNLLYLPLWLGATITGYSAFRFRLWKFSLENGLLVVGAIVLFISSRVGTLSFLLVLAFLGIYFNILLIRWLREWGLKHFTRVRPFFRNSLRRLLPIGATLAFAGIYILGAIALVYTLSHVDWRLARIFQITSWDYLKTISANIYYFFNYLAFAERVVFWVAGWNVFNLHPFLGVGLGNAGFYFKDMLPAYGWSLPEILHVLNHSTVIPNIKSLWVRILAETGIAGFSAFVTWCYILLKSGWSLKGFSSKLSRVIGWFGIFVLVALIFEGFSTDTFALPYLWVSLGILSATAATLRGTKI